MATPAARGRGAQQLAAKGARAIISFGPAVGLAPALRPGDLVIAECVVLPSGETIATDRAWRTRLVRCSEPAEPEPQGCATCRPRPAGGLGRARSARCFRRPSPPRSTARAMRSPRWRRPRACRFWRCAPSPIRPSRAGPSAAYRAARGDAYAASLLAGLGRPWELPAVWRFTRNGRAALATLREVAALGPGVPGVRRMIAPAVALAFCSRAA